MSEKGYKILVIGESRAGKTSLIMRYTNDSFLDTVSTIGVDIKVKKITINNNDYLFKIWDTAGQEKFYSLGSNFFKGVHGIIVAFDLAESSALSKLNGWISKVKENIDSTVPIVIVGTKCDLKNIKIKPESINVVASLHKSKYFETSSKNNINVTDAFTYLENEIIIQNSDDQEQMRQFILEHSDNIKKGEEKKCCKN